MMERWTKKLGKIIAVILATTMLFAFTCGAEEVGLDETGISIGTDPSAEADADPEAVALEEDIDLDTLGDAAAEEAVGMADVPVNGDPGDPAYPTQAELQANDADDTFTIEDGVLVSINVRNIKEVVIPDGVTRIGKQAFSSCTSLTGLTLSGGLATIPDYALEDCTALEELVIPAGIKTIGEHAFDGCTDLTLVVTEGSYAERYAKKAGIAYRLAGTAATKVKLSKCTATLKTVTYTYNGKGHKGRNHQQDGQKAEGEAEVLRARPHL